MPRPKKRGAEPKPRSKHGAYVVILDGQNAGKEHEIEGGLTIGRTADNQIVIHDAGVSRRHAEIKCEGGVYTLQDLGSANGTLLNDQKIGGIEVLRSGDVIVVGATGMTFNSTEDSRPLAGESTRLASMGEALGAGPPTDPGMSLAAVQPRRRARGLAVVAAVLCLLVAVGFGLLQLLRGTDMIGPADLSNEVIEVSDSNEFFDRSFGAGRFDEQHPTMASFSFSYLRGRATVHYAAWGIESQGEVVVAANGTIVGSVPTTGGAWKYGLYLEIPRNLLKAGPGNVVSFRQTREDAWEVGYIRIKQDPLLPPNPVEAENQIQLARKLHEDRDVEPANLWNAMLKYRLAADLLELANPRPESYQEAVRMADRINEELNDVFQRGRFSAEREYRFGNLEAAKGYVQQTIAHFPDRRDVRYRELQTYLEALESE